MCTALIIHMPSEGRRRVTQPSAPVRAVTFWEGFMRFMATTSALASGRFRYVK